MTYHNGNYIGTLPTHLEVELVDSKKKHFASMGHFLKRRLNKKFRDAGEKVPNIKIHVRPVVVVELVPEKPL